MNQVFVIAEAGVNHNGSLDLALQLVDVARQAGADAVKFQTFRSDQLVTAGAARAPYQIENLKESGTQLAMLQRLELAPEHHEVLAQRCREREIRFMSTAFDAHSLTFLSRFDTPAVKIASGDITAGPLLLQAARMRQPLIVSTGMATLADIEAALGVLAFGLTENRAPTGRRDFEKAYSSADGRNALQRCVTLLHCVTQYPAPPHSVNLRAMDTMRAAFGLPVGYSDHTLGIEVALAAVARGATVIEKHFTLNRSLAGPDHAASLEPEDLTRLVAGIRVIERALGNSHKGPAPEEAPNRAVVRRSLVAARAIAEGEALTEACLAVKRPATGISPMDYWDWLGRKASRDYAVDEQIEP